MISYKYPVTLPCDAPVWLDALDGGIFYVLEGEAFPDLSPIHTNADLHRADPRHGGGGITHYLRHGPSTSEAREKVIWICISGVTVICNETAEEKTKHILCV